MKKMFAVSEKNVKKNLRHIQSLFIYALASRKSRCPHQQPIDKKKKNMKVGERLLEKRKDGVAELTVDNGLDMMKVCPMYVWNVTMNQLFFTISMHQLRKPTYYSFQHYPSLQQKCIDQECRSILATQYLSHFIFKLIQQMFSDLSFS